MVSLNFEETLFFKIFLKIVVTELYYCVDGCNSDDEWIKKIPRNIPSALTWGEYILFYVLCLNMSCSTASNILKLSILLSFRRKHIVVDFFLLDDSLFVHPIRMSVTQETHF